MHLWGLSLLIFFLNIYALNVFIYIQFNLFLEIVKILNSHLEGEIAVSEHIYEVLEVLN